MFSFALVIGITAFLVGAVAAVFLTVVIGIRRNDRPKRFPGPRNAPPDSFTRTMLGTGTWPNELVAGRSRECE